MSKVSLSNINIEKLKVAKTTLFWDREILGFVLRTTPGGAKTLLFVYKHPDTRKQTKIRLGSWTKPGFGTHRARAATMRAHVDQGYCPIEFDKAEVEADRLTFQQIIKGTEPLSDVFADFIQSRRDLRRSERTIGDYERDWKRHAKPVLGAKAVRDVKRKDIADLHRKMSGTPVRANRTLVMLHGVFEFAIERELRTEGDNPCRRIKKYPEQPRSRYLDDAEIGALLQALDEAPGGDPATGCIRLQLLTGLRGCEVRGLAWSQIDMPRRVIKLTRTKTGKKRDVPLNDAAWQVLDGLTDEALRVGLVFPGSRSGKGGKPREPITHSTVDKAWRRVRELAELPDVRAHDLRHAFATRAANRLPLATAMLLTGHTTTSAFRRYYDHDPEAAAAAASVVGDAYGKVVDLSAERKKRSA
jgi:integrase